MSGAKDFSEDFMVEDAAPAGQRRQPMGGLPPGAPPTTLERETDPHRLAQRQKQVDMGKNTVGYQRYRAAVPRERRNRKGDPMTPDVYQVCSKRAFDGQIKKWRRMLHAWDLPEGQGEPALLPVQEDRPASNPAPPPAREASDDFEHISHADAKAAAPKNGAQLRPAGNLPLKIPSAMRKRAYDETVASSENWPQLGGQQQRGSLAPGGTQSVWSSGRSEAKSGGGPAAAKQARRSAEPPARGGAAARVPAAPALASEPSWAEQRYAEPQLDYGTESEDEDGWQHVAAKGGAKLPGEYKQVVYTNEMAWEEDIQV